MQLKSYLSKIRKFFTRLMPAFLILIGLLVQSINLTAFAQSQPSNPNQNGTQLFCKKDFSNFLANGIDFDGEGFLDYWGDILDIPWVGWSRYSANLCHYMEIESLLQRIDTARKQLRQAFFVCDKATVARTTKTYYELSAELYYLRHFIETKPGNIIDVKPDSKFRTELIDKFGPDGKKYFATVEETRKMYEKFKNKYAAKLETFKQCKDANLEALKEQIKSLANILDTVQKVSQQFERRIKQKNTLVNNRIKQNSFFYAENGKDFVNRLVDFRLNGEDITEPTIWQQLTSGQSDIIQELKRNNPAGVSSYTFFDAEKDIIYGQTSDLNQTLDIDYSTEYELLYKDTGDQISSEAVQNLENLKAILEGTYDHLRALKSCTSTIVGKQCPG